MDEAAYQESEAPPTAEQLAALVEADRNSRRQAAVEEINAVCRKYRVTVIPVLTIIAGQSNHSVDVRAD